MDGWRRFYEWQMVLVGAVGVALTLVFVAPGEYVVAAGPLRFDPFYALVALFAGVSLWSGVELRRTETVD
ncbi:hypothetical protein [Halomarina ordinaria]|uniref:Uncharacterized protein n=1 Tax=Halomarina ordinaria TaxID=3033939 RepID=A0ABD5UCV8_9EURY|nr:hypothetical protein [Halomarina sp. PSRA2]